MTLRDALAAAIHAEFCAVHSAPVDDIDREKTALVLSDPAFRAALAEAFTEAMFAETRARFAAQGLPSDRLDWANVSNDDRAEALDDATAIVARMLP